MRTRIITNTGTIDYPDVIAFKKDCNYIVLQNINQNGTVGAKIKVTNPSGESRQLEYESEMSKITFDISDTILNLFDDDLNYWQLEITPSFNGVVYQQFTALMKVYDGKTFRFRNHGSSKTYYYTVNKDLQTFQIFVKNAGTMTYKGNNYTLAAGINTFNLSLTNPNDVETLHITTSGDDEAGGNGWSDCRIPDMSDYTARLVRQEYCDNENFLRVVYRDCDGCFRSITGVMIGETVSVKKDDYIRNWDLINSQPHKFQIGQSDIVKAVFTDIDRDSNFADILYSDWLMIQRYDGTWQEAVCETSKLDLQKEKTADYQLEFKILA